MQMKRVLIISLLLLTGIAKAQEREAQTKMPEFPGGDNAFYEYLDTKVELPEGFNKKQYLKKHKNQFVPVSVGFTVDVDGTVTNVKVIDGENELLDKKAIEIVQNMPKWVPGLSAEGKPIKVDFAIPIRFNLL